ncbi:hypothetical protein [Actinomadura chibensis]|uniref:Uncharacterized protein n=1 Tax=Actinomadura chibensis TaxID=392828 RepID=A0A5D0NHU6_9ACTN|nr:hypothetical protein [Actinomadura chibensis]TYB44007.1 hypothetical protein FXF69_23895 [Actinomadura chibensis]
MPVLSLDFPVLLGPVRVETRFTRTELLVRVFPDEWAIDKFEPRPTRAELAALDAYWTGVWASGGSEVGERAAWHELVARVPAGRAGWLLQGHRPANPADRPTGVPPTTTVLVIVSAAPPAANDRQPAVTYWTAVWRAHGDRAKLRDADVALLAAVGKTRADAIRARRPQGVDSAPVTGGDDVVVSFLVLPPPAADQIAPQSWTVAAKATLLPDRFVAFGYVNGAQVFAEPGGPVRPELAVSPDPGETAANQLRIDETTGALTVPPALRWLTDFTEAVDAGMGIRIPLQAAFQNGVDRLVVLGLREQATPEQSATALGALLTRQLRSPAGFSLLPQGTPTNNTEQAPAGQDAKAEAEAGLATAAGFAATAADWTTKTDGEWFAELLGLDPAVLAGVPNAEGADRRDARAAHTALWPATWGYYLGSLLNGVLTDDQIAQTRAFFVQHVSGRGPLSAVKIGRQPYGILPTTVFSRLAWPDTAKHRRALNAVLAEAAKDWHGALAHVAHLDGTSDDPHQALLDILALHPTSAEFHQRYAQSVEDIFNRENLRALGPQVKDALERQLAMPQPIRALLARLGRPTSDPAADPDLLRRLFTDVHHPLLAPLVDDRPLSETDPIRAYTGDRRNYLSWLADNARDDLDKVREEKGFLDDLPPSALLYLLARHAVLLGWAEAARRLALATPGVAAPDPRDAPFVHVKIPRPGQTIPSESRYRTLYSTDPAMTGGQSVLVHEYIRTVLGTHPATAELDEQIRALGLLAGLPTARLERVLAEHVDCATYRLDAWRLGLANERLAELRYGPGGTDAPRRGVHLGAYGWLENVARRTSGETAPVTPPADLATVFGTAPIPVDPANGGYVHTPSPAHARTAAVLRAGYLANRTPDTSAFAVNLSSERVRLALTILDGMRQGQSLGALLGYRFERGLHDRRAGLDRYIAGLRLKFPLRANKIEETVPAPDDPARPRRVEQVEARNVIDGLALLRHVDALPEADRHYPFGFTDLRPADADVAGDIGKEIDALRDVRDALADLAVAEGTHQALQGHPERASATLDAYAKEGVAPEPSVVETPRSGTTLTHRLGLQLMAGRPPGRGAPRGMAEPGVNAWLPAVLPNPTAVAALVTWRDPDDGTKKQRLVTQQETGLEPIDLLWALRPADEAAMTDLDDRILGVVVDQSKPRPDVELTIEYTTRISDQNGPGFAGKIGFFELSPLVAALRTLLTSARPLRPSDLVPAAGSAPLDRSADDAVSLPRERPAEVLKALTGLRDDVTGFISDLGALYPDGADPDRAALVGGIDTFLTRYAKLAVAAGGFGLVRSGWGELAQWRRGVFAAVLAAVAEVADRMARALAAADALLDQYDHLPASTPAEERFKILQQAEGLLTTKPGPRPATPRELRDRVGRLRARFADRLQDVKRIAKTKKTTLSGLLAEVAALLPLTDVDPAGLDLAPYGDQVVAYGRELLARAGKLKDELSERADAATKALAVYDKAIPGPDRVQAAVDALKALLGEDVLAVPQFTPPGPLLQQWSKARNDGDRLVAHLTPARDFPVDDWLHGMARVREKPRLWEKAVMLASGLLGPGGLLGVLGWKEPPLTPVQFPYVAGDHWLALEFAKDPNLPDQLAEDRLLFTAHYTAPLVGDQCGLVFDEWTEVIPAERETTGIAVHYDGPDAEPPQAMLLVVPPVRDPAGRWTPADLLDAITETFDLAKTRAVEPGHLDGTPYAHLLPATVMSATRRQITVSTDLAIANLRWKAVHE